MFLFSFRDFNISEYFFFSFFGSQLQGYKIAFYYTGFVSDNCFLTFLAGGVDEAGLFTFLHF